MEYEDLSWKTIFICLDKGEFAKELEVPARDMVIKYYNYNEHCVIRVLISTGIFD